MASVDFDQLEVTVMFKRVPNRDRDGVQGFAVEFNPFCKVRLGDEVYHVPFNPFPQQLLGTVEDGRTEVADARSSNVKFFLEQNDDMIEVVHHADQIF